MKPGKMCLAGTVGECCNLRDHQDHAELYKDESIV